MAKLQEEIDAAEDAWLAWQERMANEREELSKRRRAAQVAFQNAFAVNKEMATIKREYPELAGLELSSQAVAKGKKAKSKSPVNGKSLP